MNYLIHITILISIYSILAFSLNLLVGYNGTLSLSHAAFYGIGAYIFSLLQVDWNISFLTAMVAAVIGTVCVSFLISVPSLRLRGDYFVLASLGFQIIVFSVLYSWVGVTHGPFGISNIPRPSVFGRQLNSNGAYLIFSAAVALACGVLLYFIGHSPFGRLLKAIREDVLAAASLGKNVALHKVLASTIGAGFASLAGALLAGYLGYIDPTSFTLTESVFILSIIIIGGTGNLKGPLIGTFLMILMPEALRFIGFPDSIAPNVRLVVYGVLILLIMRYRPKGLLGEYGYK